MTQEQSKKGASSRAGAFSARLLAVQALYQLKQNKQSVRGVVNEYLKHRTEMEVDGEKLAPPDGPLLEKIVYGVEERFVELESVIAANLKKEETGRAVEPLLQAIFLCGAYELLVQQHIDSPIIINDYLNVGHAFYSKNEVALINGVLDSMASLFKEGL